MYLERKINLSQFKIQGLEGDANYELFGYIHIEGTELNSCSYASVTKIDTNKWIF